jgi:hypothetical protein
MGQCSLQLSSSSTCVRSWAKPKPTDMAPHHRLPAAMMYTRLYSFPRMPTNGENSACRVHPQQYCDRHPRSPPATLF